jgi:hypothetical protein
MIDSVYAMWELHNPAHIVKEMSQPIGICIFFGYGLNDEIEAVPEANESFADTLDMLGIDYVKFVDNGGHGTTVERMEAALMFCDSCMYGTGIQQGTAVGSLNIQTCPNPFSTSSTISFEMVRNDHAALDIYDISGRIVENLVNGQLASGHHSFCFDGSGLVPGIYLVRLTTETTTSAARCVLIR